MGGTSNSGKSNPEVQNTNVRLSNATHTSSLIFRNGNRGWFRWWRFRQYLSIDGVLLKGIRVMRKGKFKESCSDVLHGVAPHVCCCAMVGALRVQEHASTKIHTHTHVLVESTQQENYTLLSRLCLLAGYYFMYNVKRMSMSKRLCFRSIWEGISQFPIKGFCTFANLKAS